MTPSELTQLADDLQRFADEHLDNGLENYREQFISNQLIVLVARGRVLRNENQLALTL